MQVGDLVRIKEKTEMAIVLGFGYDDVMRPCAFINWLSNNKTATCPLGCLEVVCK